MSLEFIQSNEEIAISALTEKITNLLAEGKKVVWLVTGGSNIALAALAANAIFARVPPDALTHLAITLTDERYGNVGHPESNWQRLIEASFDFSKVGEAVPVLVGASLEETVTRYSHEVQRLFTWADAVVGQFGVGPDGHIAGVLPYTIGTHSTDTTVGYESALFTRVTLTLATIQKISSAYALIFGASKRDIVTALHIDASLDDMPAQILKKVPEAYVYTDQQ
jgi:6-phosphogluconolactonase/glucosamine-6-phosphate isomerase/deaminase